MSRIGNELIEEILLRLPPTCVGRIKWVCKQWLAVTSDPSFVRRYYTLHPFPPLTGVFLSRASGVDFLPLSLAQHGFYPSPSMPDPSSEPKLHASCNGLILLSSRLVTPEVCYVCNPTTGSTHVLPELAVKYPSKVSYHLAFDPMNDWGHGGGPSHVFTVVSIEHSDFPIFHTYSSATRQWRQSAASSVPDSTTSSVPDSDDIEDENDMAIFIIDSGDIKEENNISNLFSLIFLPDDPYNVEDITYLFRSGVYLKRSMYWIPDSQCNCMCILHITEERLISIPLPSLPHMAFSKRVIGLSASGGHLHLTINYGFRELLDDSTSKPSFDVWELNPDLYGWTLLYSFTNPLNSNESVTFLRKEGEAKQDMLIRHPFIGPSLLYNVVDNTLMEIKTSGGLQFWQFWFSTHLSRYLPLLTI